MAASRPFKADMLSANRQLMGTLGFSVPSNRTVLAHCSISFGSVEAISWLLRMPSRKTLCVSSGIEYWFLSSTPFTPFVCWVAPPLTAMSGYLVCDLRKLLEDRRVCVCPRQVYRSRLMLSVVYHKKGIHFFWKMKSLWLRARLSVSSRCSRLSPLGQLCPDRKIDIPRNGPTN
jgi:hypothetical protein